MFFIELCPPTVEELGLLCGSFHFNHQLALPKKFQGIDDEAFNSYDYCLYGLRCAVQENIEQANCMKLAFEGYLSAALFHGIFHIVPSDYADDDSIKIPGTVTTTKLQFKKIDNPNWAAVPKKIASTYNRVHHRCHCFLLSINLLNGTSVLPHLFESVVYEINDKKITKGANNQGANNAKRKNYDLVQQKVKYNMMMLHKASLSGKFFVFFHILTIDLFCKIENIT